ncbi:hypothetical protein BDV36DRAFT_92701 [Aspergillus pseudocaelatus]|uniref:Uncharacterized protein n=1 Tax=Aspergillus pseudocaelatus TaxID=1825620 RepID=A0ABQ6X2I2_9EURO|nr:hypothetical protein BDV36DRAFT_92701 [Aspergillus pseudocaelatus]
MNEKSPPTYALIYIKSIFSIYIYSIFSSFFDYIILRKVHLDFLDSGRVCAIESAPGAGFCPLSLPLEIAGFRTGWAFRGTRPTLVVCLAKTSSYGVKVPSTSKVLASRMSWN